jgi:transposase
MARPYSEDLRSRVAASVLSGRTCRTTAELFGVSVASVARWSKQLRDTDSVAAKPMGGVRRAVLLDHKDWLLARIAAVPDLTLRGLKAELARRGVVVSHWAVWKLLASEGISFKKNRSAGRAGSRRHRQPAAALAEAANHD